MQFDTSARRALFRSARDSLIKGPKLTEDLSLQMYLEPPTETITLREFEQFALDRLRVLQLVEQTKERLARDIDEVHDALSKDLAKLMPIACGAVSSENLEEERRRDIISHFILRLAFCQTPDQTKWFIQQEVDLFKFRFKTAAKTRGLIERFLNANNFKTSLLSSEDVANLAADLSAVSAIPEQAIVKTDFWKVAFTEALDLIRKRRVLLRDGYAYVSENDLIVILCTRLRVILSSSMARARRYIGFIEEEERLLPLLDKLTNKLYLGKTYGGQNASSSVTANMVDTLCKASFPLCMRHIHSRLRTEHHLRHGARLQYGLFLKAIGLSLEEALAFWRAEFTRKMDSDKFEKLYAYNIRHNYGKEGRHADYPAYSCSKIILGIVPATGDCNGCPYRHMETQMLSQKLQGIGLSKEQSIKIMSLSKEAKYDKACTVCFEYVHKMNEGSLGTLITHPNQYFELSREIHEGKRKRAVKRRVEVLSQISEKDAVSDSELEAMDLP